MGRLTGSEVGLLARKQAATGPQPDERYRDRRGFEVTVVCQSIDEATLRSLVTYRHNIIFWTVTMAVFKAEFVRVEG